jgi:hypothetical protein
VGDRDNWLSAFADELQRLRPHLSDKVARVIAMSQYGPDKDPVTAARDYHTAQGGEVPAKGRKTRK